MIQLSTAAKSARLEGLKNFIAAGSGTARLRLYAGPQPPLGGTPAGAALVTVDLYPAIGTVSGDALTLLMPEWVLVSATGEIAWGRLTNRADALVADLACGLTGSGQAIELNTLSVYAGGLLAITAATLRE